jgi:outer membrane protein TolC
MHPTLVAQALASRPEIREAAARVRAAEELERREELRPYIPELRLSARGGGLGGGPCSDFGRFSEQGDLSVGLVWHIRGLGLAEGPARRQREARRRQAAIAQSMVRDHVVEEVAVAWRKALDARRRTEHVARNVEESLRSLDLNLRRIRGVEGLPIEALQAIQASAAARLAWVNAVAGFNRAQLRLLRAVGRTPDA